MTITESTHALSTTQSHYGPAAQYQQRQEIYQATTRQCVAKASEVIQRVAGQASPNFVPVFHELSNTFARTRQELAIQAGTEYAEDFGTLATATNDEFFPCTPLTGVYASANQIVLRELHQQIRAIPFEGPNFASTTHKIEETVLNRRFSFETQIFDASTMLQKSNHTAQELGKVRVFFQKIRQDNPSATNFACVAQLKQKHPDLYAKDRFHSCLAMMEEDFPSPKDVKYSINRKSHYILSTMRTQIGNKMYATCQWLTWLAQEGATDPRDQLIKLGSQPVVYLLPQDIFLHDVTKKECARLYDQNLHWDKTKSTVNELKEQVALFRYLFAQASFYKRGSAALGEWHEQSVFDALGFPGTSYHPIFEKESVDLVAQIVPSFSEYLRRYHTLVHIPGDGQHKERLAELEIKREEPDGTSSQTMPSSASSKTDSSDPTPRSRAGQSKLRRARLQLALRQK